MELQNFTNCSPKATASGSIAKGEIGTPHPLLVEKIHILLLTSPKNSKSYFPFNFPFPFFLTFVVTFTRLHICFPQLRLIHSSQQESPLNHHHPAHISSLYNLYYTLPLLPSNNTLPGEQKGFHYRQNHT